MTRDGAQISFSNSAYRFVRVIVIFSLHRRTPVLFGGEEELKIFRELLRGTRTFCGSYILKLPLAICIMSVRPPGFGDPRPYQEYRIV